MKLFFLQFAMMTSDEPVEKLQKQLYCLNMATPGSQSHPVAPATPVEPKDTSANMTGEITGEVWGHVFGSL